MTQQEETIDFTNMDQLYLGGNSNYKTISVNYLHMLFRFRRELGWAVRLSNYTSYSSSKYLWPVLYTSKMVSNK